jgi:hypothetical protein
MSFRLASRFLAPLVLTALASTAIGCGAEDPTVADEDNLVEGQCKILGSTGKALAAKAQTALDDPFAKLVLAGGAGTGKCANTSDLVLARLKASAGSSDKVFVVSERADEGKKTTDYRFVVAQTTATSKAEELFVSVLGSPTDGIAQDFMEVMSFSKAKGAYVYYALGGGGKWTLKGDGTMVNPGTKSSLECASCHTSGGPNFKELQLPWNNWNSFSFSMPNPPEQAASFAALFGRKSGAESLEGIIVSGDKLWAKSRVDAVLAGKAPGQTLKTLLKSVMCEVGEPNLVSNKSKHTSRLDPITPPSTLNLPPSLLVNQVLSSAGEVGYSSLGGMTFSKLSGITIKGTDYLAALKANGQTLDNGPADTIFGLFAPERGFADNMITEELLRRNLLTKDTLADLLVADFTNPVFSTERCGLAATAPDAGVDAEAIRTAWLKNLETSTLKGAAALKARLAKTDDFAANQTTIDTFVTACANRATADGVNFAKDITKLASQRRREFNDQFSNLVESADLLPNDKVKDAVPHAFRLNATTCALEKQ